LLCRKLNYLLSTNKNSCKASANWILMFCTSVEANLHAHKSYK
jgi:hypothetical protein